MPRLDKSFKFRFIGNFPEYESLKNEVLSITEDEWKKFTYRQETIVGHKDTLTVPLVFDHVKRSGFITHNNYGKFLPHLNSISKYLLSVGELNDIRRANIVLLKPNSFIKKHQDKGDFLEKTRRIHLAVTTNQWCYLTVEDTKQHFVAGEMWEIDNTGKFHSAHNEGDTNRIHLIIDVN